MHIKFESYLTKEFPYLKEASLLIACSGGLDSVVLTHLLHASGYNISLAHCNFSLRAKESDADEQFVVHLAKKLQIPVFTETFDTKAFAVENKLSTQMAARRLRYRWFTELAEITKQDYILTAHHLDDDLETFLINSSRGTGLKGLCGIPEVHNNIIRPLLGFSKEEILDYATQNKLKWREDSSNTKKEYLRNALRFDVIPKWKQTNNQLLYNFKTTQKHLRESQALIEDYTALIFSFVTVKQNGGYKFSVEKLKKLPNTKAVLYALLHPFGFKEWEDVYHLLYAQSGKQVFSENFVLLKDRAYLILDETASAKAYPPFNDYTISKETNTINTPIALNFETVKEITKAGGTDTIFVDADTLEYPFRLRKWQKGDVFYPYGMDGKKKLSKFFKDEKLSLLAKQKTWLLCSAEKIVWIVGLRADNRFKVTPKTKNILKIELQK